MRSALTLARRGLGNVWPNPAVGCVLVREDLNNRVVGRGWTQPGGSPHAETEALARAGDLARGATAYVTLEPCSHVGRTDPCADALIEAGISRTVVAAIDPDPRVSGRGIARLRKAGIATDVGLLGPEAKALNSGFWRRQQSARPIVTLKIATTADGFVASRNGDSQWITGSEARQHSHFLRAQHDAILTGIGTVEADNPMLTCRLPGLSHLSPIRVVMDSKHRLGAETSLALSADIVPVWRIGAEGTDFAVDSSAVVDLRVPNVPHEGLNLTATLTLLSDHGVTRLLVEAGPKLSTSFLRQDLVDQLAWYRAPTVMGSDGLPVFGGLNVDGLADMRGFAPSNTMELGVDNLTIYTRRLEA